MKVRFYYEIIVSPSNMTTKVTLVCKEGENFTIDISVAKLSITLKNLVDEIIDNNNLDDVKIPIPNVDAETFLQIVEWMTHHTGSPIPDNQDTEENNIKVSQRHQPLPEWDNEFLSRIDLAQLFRLVLAVNYLDIQILLDYIFKVIAKRIKDQTNFEPAKIREMFGVTRDFTEEERAEVKKQNPWMV